MKSFFIAAISVVAVASCAAPPPARSVAAPPPPIKYIEPEVGLNNSGLDPSLTSKLDKIVKTAMEEAVAPGVAIAVGRNGRGNIQFSRCLEGRRSSSNSPIV